jgi:hypothetical protein
VAISFTNASDGVCLNWCNQNPGFVGVTVHQQPPTVKRCYCLFSEGVPKAIKSDGNAYDPAWEVALSQPGVGNVQTTDGDDEAICYANYNLAVSPSQSPTRSPSKAPSNVPSKALHLPKRLRQALLRGLYSLETTIVGMHPKTCIHQ